MAIEPTWSRPRWRRGLLLGLGTVVALRVLGMMLLRSHRPDVLDRLRRINKLLVNPPMRAVAGRGHFFAAQLEHMGRRSGRFYRTPIIALPVTGGFAVPLPYGTGVDWLRNLRAAGSGTLLVKGKRYTVRAPSIVETTAMSTELPPYWRMAARMYDIQQVVRLAATPVPAPEPVPASHPVAVPPLEPVDSDA